MVSIALGSTVYVFSPSKGGDVHQLCDLGSNYVTSVQWNKSGKYLAVGTSEAQVQVSAMWGVAWLWEPAKHKCRQVLCGVWPGCGDQ
jgi:WD40 repeat protein